MTVKKEDMHAPDVTFPPDRVHLQDGTTRAVEKKDTVRRNLLSGMLKIAGKEARKEWLRKALRLTQDEK